MSSEKRKRIKTPTGLFFTSLEMKERVGVQWTSFSDPVGSFFTRLEMGERVESSGPLFHELGNKKAN